ncbi:hypothetical protein [Pseudooceanicola sp. LIPI14-2-Ac024]|uniref:hypothetical protein n=1 Tax=Pseudooceanicola sp. LIPI14-2-Ac024 TaxID=3344875 RepID=UPI0035D0108B
MKRSLYLHIGSHRTATSSIQAFMHANREAFIARGCLYPYNVKRHFKIVNEILNGHADVADVAADLNARCDNKDVPIDRIVISDEDICMRQDLEPLARLRDHFDVKVIFYLRRQDHWLESWYLQNVKWQWNPRYSHCTFDEFLAMREDFHWIHYDRYVKMLEKRFGAENLQLVVFEKDQMPGGPVIEFCRQIGFDDVSEMGKPAHTNASHSAEMVEFMRHLPLDALDGPERELVRRTLEQVDREHLGHTGKQSELILPLSARSRVLGKYQKGNAALAKRLFDRKELFLDPLPARDAPLARLEIPRDSAAAIERFVAPLILQLVANGTISSKNRK